MFKTKIAVAVAMDVFQRDMLGATAATLCIREFESPTLSWKNERFIPHVLV